MPRLSGFSHVELTVTDAKRAVAWWNEVLGFRLINRERSATFEVWAMMHPSGMVVDVMTHDDSPPGAFDERRVGLDHLSFEVADRSALDEWVGHLDAKGVKNSGVLDIGYGPTVVFRDPDNIQLELMVHPTDWTPDPDL
jgi:glyoxylase I family protein